MSYVDVGGTADERAFLESIEREYGVQVLRLALSDHLGLVEGSDRQLWHVEVPSLDYLWKARVAIGQTMRARGARVLLSGHWGDQMLFSTGYLVDLARRGAWIEVMPSSARSTGAGSAWKKPACMRDDSCPSSRARMYRTCCARRSSV